MSSPPPNTLTPGTVVAGRYRIVAHLGSGGFGSVYEAHHIAIDTSVALKILYATENPQAHDRFLQEARAAGRVDHPNVITVHDFGLGDDGRPFIVMELLKGCDLASEIVRHGPMRPKRALPLFIDCLDALGEAHKQGVVHKDLKPSNLFLHHRGRRTESLKILDFGIARLRGSQMTHSGQTIGTAQYLAPEYIEHQQVTPALDVYQTGLILVEVFSGRPAVSASTWWGAIATHLNHELAIPESLRACPLGPVLDKALNADPQARYPDGFALRDALEGLDIDAIEAAVELPRADTATDNKIFAGAFAIRGAEREDLNPVMTDPLPPPPKGYALVRPGTFLMGSSKGEIGRYSNEAAWEVALTRPYIIGQTPVTQKAWAALMGRGPSFFEGPDRPVEQISWFDALALCNAMSRRDGLEPCYTFETLSADSSGPVGIQAVRFAGLDAEGWRLPTEAEWELAARAGTTSPIYAGPFLDAVEDRVLATVAWYKINSGGKTHPVGSKPPNALSLFDMLGNVCEWVWDAYAAYPTEKRRNPIQRGAFDQPRVFRGGSWNSLARDCRAARRGSAPPGTRNSTIGVRPVRTWHRRSSHIKPLFP